jgi:alpha-ribazole phosphatase/probable phosphoglycerate mutase
MNHPANCGTVLWLIRHPEPDEAVRGTCYGSLDVPLSPHGIEHAQSIARWLASHRLDAVYTSPSKRCIDTARCIAVNRSCGVEPADGLRELDFGEFEGRRYDEIAELHPDLYRDWMEDPTRVQFPGGENFQEMATRVIAAAHALVSRHSGQQILFVSHGGPNRIILAEVLGVPSNNLFRIAQRYGAINCIRYNGNLPAVELMNVVIPDWFCCK